MKSKALAIIFGLLPGAGQMYLGKMKRGMTMMTVFFGAIFLIAFFGIGAVALLLPIIWFYAFFDVLNLCGMPRDQFDALPDELAFGLFDTNRLSKGALSDWMSRQARRWTGWGLVAAGLVLLYKNFARSFFSFLSEYFGTDFFYDFYYRVPEFIISLVVILIGIRLIWGGRRSKSQPDEIPPYHAGNEREGK